MDRNLVTCLPTHSSKSNHTVLYADDLVLMADSEDLLVDKTKMWEVGMEEKGLRVNMGKTKDMRCPDSASQVGKSGKYPCGVCRKAVGSNCIQVRHAMRGFIRNGVASQAS